MLQGVLQGESISKIASRLGNVAEMNKTSAVRNARTMVTGAENRGRYEGFKKAENDGIIFKKKWISTLDGRTRHSHAMLNGELQDNDNEFSNGLMYPGDPHGRPEEVYNCRCTLGSKIVGFNKFNSGKSAGGDDNFGKPGNPVQIGTVDFSDKNAIREALNKAKKEVENLDYEVNFSITSDGKIWRVDGSSGNVNPEDIPSNLKGSFSYHNHPPSATHYSFSAEDIRSFYEYGEIYAEASDNLFEYVIARTPDTIDKNYNEAYNEFKDIYMHEILNMSRENKIDIDFDGFHETMKILSERYKFNYRRRRKYGN